MLRSLTRFRATFRGAVPSSALVSLAVFAGVLGAEPLRAVDLSLGGTTAWLAVEELGAVALFDGSVPEQPGLGIVQVSEAGADLDVVQTGAKPQQLDLTRAEAAALRDEIATLYDRLNLFTITAPIAGVVVRSFGSDTLLTVLDGYPRVMGAGCRVARPDVERLGKLPYWIVMVVMMVGALLIFRYVTAVMRPLVDFTMTLAFL